MGENMWRLWFTKLLLLAAVLLAAAAVETRLEGESYRDFIAHSLSRSVHVEHGANSSLSCKIDLPYIVKLSGNPGRSRILDSFKPVVRGLQISSGELSRDSWK